MQSCSHLEIDMGQLSEMWENFVVSALVRSQINPGSKPVDGESTVKYYSDETAYLPDFQK
jgi:hypothetical protein